jgi:seryl-tRNA synthetase
MDQIRAIFAQMQQDEVRMQTARLQVLRTADRRLQVALWIGLAVGLLGGLAADVLFVKSIVSRVRRLNENAGLLSEGKPPYGLPPGNDEIGQLARRMEVAGELLRARERELADADAELQAALASLPNPPDPTAADADTVVREVGVHGGSGPDHLEVAGPLIDAEAGARVSGSRFVYLTGDLVLLEFALVRWGLSVLEGHGFRPVIPPVLVREEALYGTGFLPDTEQQIYRLPDDDLFLVGTSEVPLASLHAGEILEEGVLPLRYAGFSSCFRREAGAAGRDTRGIFRVHQFDKLEMFSFVDAEESANEHERLLAIEEELLQALGIPYRVVNIGADDLGNSAAKKYDLEAWMPGRGGYGEVTSTSNTTDFQSRRLNIRHRPGPRHVHTLNGTAVTWRHMIALLENHGLDVPDVLQEWGAPARLRVGEP